MHIHIAIFRWKPNADLDDIARALLEIQSLATKIDGIVEIAVGENSSRYSEGYTHVVLVRGDSQEAIDAYRQHPDHQRAAAVIDSAEEHGVGVDFVAGEFRTGPRAS